MLDTMLITGIDKFMFIHSAYTGNTFSHREFVRRIVTVLIANYSFKVSPI